MAERKTVCTPPIRTHTTRQDCTTHLIDLQLNLTMNLIETVAILITLSAIFSYINHRWLRLPTTIGVMLIGLLVSLALTTSGEFVPAIQQWAKDLLLGVDFNATVMHGMLGYLLFAGALHVNLNDLTKQKFVIALLATVGVLLSTVLIGGITWLILRATGVGTPFVFCLLFGALISPTDPIAVLAILKRIGVPESLKTKIAGESLFNDGVGVVVFLAVAMAAGLDPHHGALTTASLTNLFVTEALGGTIFGLVIGLTAYQMLKSVDNYQVEILISLALVAGGYTLADRLHLSGPIAMVVAGLLMGNHGRRFAMSARTREHLDLFWELVDEILNAVLFVLIGLELIVLRLTGASLLAGLAVIPVVLAARFTAVGLPVTVLRWTGRDFTPHTVKILTWAGLRGGISVALALSIPKTVGEQPIVHREVILAITYCVVVFSIAVQGLTTGRLIRWCGMRSRAGH